MIAKPKERPILFSGAMVRAILDGRKTQTRRAMKPQPADDVAPHAFPNDEVLCWISSLPHAHGSRTAHFSPYGQPGDRLWVRESFTDLLGTGIEHRPYPAGPKQRYAYTADTIAGSASDEVRKDFGIKWRPSIHMPRSACRLVLEIVNVRVERLQAISEADAMAEGAEPILVPPDGGSCPHVEGFRDLWTSINGASSWEANRFVWVIEFKRVEAPHG